jgi:hypothetical protein
MISKHEDESRILEYPKIFKNSLDSTAGGKQNKTEITIS